MSERFCEGTGHEATMTLVKVRLHRVEEPLERLLRQLHTDILTAAGYPMVDP